MGDISSIADNGTTDTRELLKAQTRVYRDVLGLGAAMSLRCAVLLDIPDIIHRHGQPVSLSTLISSLPNPIPSTSSLRRLMRLLSHMGYFSIHHRRSDQGYDDELYSLTPLSVVLLKDSPTSLSNWLLGMLDMPVVTTCRGLSKWFQQNEHPTTCELEYGKSIWQLASETPEINQSFNDTMASETSLVLKVVVTECKEVFKGVKSLVDVGGGNGTCARVIKQAFPEIKCTVFDLPHVIATVPESGGLVEAVQGNMFDYVPEADAVFLKLILHDWPDEDCVRILKQCKKAISGSKNGGKVILVDIVLGDDNANSKLTETQLLCDLLIMVSCEGKERHENEWKSIFTAAGFTSYKITPLGVRSLIEIFP